MTGVSGGNLAMDIEHHEIDGLARELAAETGETLIQAIQTALRERLERERARNAGSMRIWLARLAADVAAMRVADGRAAEEIIGYDHVGLPR